MFLEADNPIECTGDDYGPGPGERVQILNRRPRTKGFAENRKPRSRRTRPSDAPRSVIEPQVRHRPARPFSVEIDAHALPERLAALRERDGTVSNGRALWECTRAAVAELVTSRDKPHADELSARLYAKIWSRIETLLRENALCLDLSTEARDRRILNTVHQVLLTYNVDKTRERVRYGHADAVAARALLTGGILPNALLDQFTAAARVKGIKLDRAQMRTALVIGWRAAAKSILRNKHGALPTSSIAGALLHYGFNWTEDRRLKLTSVLVAALTRLELIGCTDASYGRRRCRRYQVRGLTHRLPFVAEFTGVRRRRVQHRLVTRAKTGTLKTRAAAAVTLLAPICTRRSVYQLSSSSPFTIPTHHRHPTWPSEYLATPTRPKMSGLAA